jgi:hypothetical protein
VRFEALAAQRAGMLGRAETLYRRALEENPADVDSLHMLGVVQYERSRYRDALESLAQAATLAGWSLPGLRRNVELVLSKLLARDANVQQAQLLAAWVEHQRQLRATHVAVTPLVSVVLTLNDAPADNVRALQAVVAQTYAPLELLVVGSPAQLDSIALYSMPGTPVAIPMRHVASAHTSLAGRRNAAGAEARGEFLAFLASDKWYAPDGIAHMVDAIARRGARWGFATSGYVTHPQDDARPHAVAQAVTHPDRASAGSWPNSFQLLKQDFDIADANVFIERALFSALGGFRELEASAGRDLCLRAACFAEPVAVSIPLFMVAPADDPHGMVPPATMAPLPDTVLQRFLSRALDAGAPVDNPLAPLFVGNRSLLLRTLLRENQSMLSQATFEDLVNEWRAGLAAPVAQERPAHRNASPQQRTALVVLGMHRSGTSALARVLNLCGAFLPENVSPPKPGVNPKGFWEPEAVVDLNNRLIGRLGGTWTSTSLSVPLAGAMADDFLADVQAVVAQEYGDQALILVKDPRICMLAPLWDRALRVAGYRPTYVVPVRDPVEVAQSLRARDGLGLADGLMLWHAYTQKADAFAATCSDVAYVRFTDLLADWRSAVARISMRLGVALDPADNESDIGQFLDADLRNQKGQDALLETLLDPVRAGQVRALYLALLARCDADAIQGMPAGAPAWEGSSGA